MSKYEWERGTISIPKAQWASFRKGLLTKWNEHQQGLLEDAKGAYRAIQDAAKGKRGAKRQETLRSALRAHCEAAKSKRPCPDPEPEWGSLISYLIIRSKDVGGGSVVFQSPRKVNLETKPLSRGLVALDLDNTSVTFDNARKTVNWFVPENNHACERARSHWFAKALFEALDRITWTRNSGGKIIGNDEYNCYTAYESGGANYVTAKYGPT